MEMKRANWSALPAGTHALLLGLALIAQLGSNFVLPGLGIAFLAVLFRTSWFGGRSDRIVLAVGAALSAAYLAVPIIDGLAPPTVGYQFG